MHIKSKFTLVHTVHNWSGFHPVGEQGEASPPNSLAPPPPPKNLTLIELSIIIISQ